MAGTRVVSESFIGGRPLCRTCDDSGFVDCPKCQGEMRDVEVCGKCNDYGEITCPGCRLEGEPAQIGPPPLL